jgi:hypothetical protein
VRPPRLRRMRRVHQIYRATGKRPGGCRTMPKSLSRRVGLVHWCSTFVVSAACSGTGSDPSGLALAAIDESADAEETTFAPEPPPRRPPVLLGQMALPQSSPDMPFKVPWLPIVNPNAANESISLLLFIVLSPRFQTIQTDRTQSMQELSLCMHLP